MRRIHYCISNSTSILLNQHGATDRAHTSAVIARTATDTAGGDRVQVVLAASQSPVSAAPEPEVGS